MPRKTHPKTGEWMYLVPNNDHSLNEPSYVWLGRHGSTMEATEEEIDDYLGDEPTLG